MIALSVYVMGYLFQENGIWYATLVCEGLTLLFTIWFLYRHRKGSMYSENEKNLSVS